MKIPDIFADVYRMLLMGLLKRPSTAQLYNLARHEDVSLIYVRPST